jgi:hypothetical protein
MCVFFVKDPNKRGAVEQGVVRWEFLKSRSHAEHVCICCPKSPLNAKPPSLPMDNGNGAEADDLITFPSTVKIMSGREMSWGNGNSLSDSLPKVSDHHGMGLSHS